MAIETALIKPVVDALMALLQRGEKATLKRNAEAALREAIRELLLANPDENKAQARCLGFELGGGPRLVGAQRGDRGRFAGVGGRGDNRQGDAQQHDREATPQQGANIHVPVRIPWHLRSPRSAASMPDPPGCAKRRRSRVCAGGRVVSAPASARTCRC